MNGKMIEFLLEQWATLDDGQSRIVFPPGQNVFSGLRRSGNYLHVDPGGFRAPFIMNVPATMQYRTTKMH